VRLRHAVGCEHCRGTGYRGRTGIFEGLSIGDKVRRAITARSDAATIRDLALREEFVPMRHHGWTLCEAGVTTIEEVWRAVAA
jgi:type II secretory ATPase GspE/PulE/Tfp pilus assembly ATPase PilB-like protein